MPHFYDNPERPDLPRTQRCCICGGEAVAGFSICDNCGQKSGDMKKKNV